MSGNFTVGLIKCGATAFIDTVLRRINEAGLEVVACSGYYIPPRDIDELYAAHVGKPYWADLLYSVNRSAVWRLVIKGEDAVKRWRWLMGATDPKQANGYSIRGAFGNKEGPIAENAVHGSDSDEAALRELKILFENWAEIIKSRALEVA